MTKDNTFRSVEMELGLPMSFVTIKRAPDVGRAASKTLLISAPKTAQDFLSAIQSAEMGSLPRTKCAIC